MNKSKASHHTSESGKKGLLGYILGGIGISVVSLLLVAYWFTANVVTGVNEKHQNKLIEIYTQQIQSHFNSVVKQQGSLLSEIATRSDVIRAIESNSMTAIELVESQVLKEVKGAISVHLISKGAGQIDNEVSPPISFASLDLVRRSEQGQNVGMEILSHQDRYYIQVARPVRNGQIIGTLIVNLDTVFLSNALETFDETAGNLTLKQKFESSEPQSILTHGAKNANAPISVTTINPNWALSFQPTDAIVKSDILLPAQIIVPMGAVIIIVIVSLFAAGIMLQTTVKTDAGNFTRYTQKLLSGQSIDVPNFKLGLFLAMAKNLARVRIKTRQPNVKEATNPFNSPVYPSDSESVTQDKGTLTPQDDILDIDMIDGDMDILGINKQDSSQFKKSAVQDKIFRAYDIRGIYGQTLDRSVAHQIGLALGSEAYERGEQTVIVARDGRNSGPDLTKGLIAGLIESGRDVIDLGLVHISMLYFAYEEIGVSSGIMVTASHQPANINGFKITLGGQDLVQKEIMGLYHRINNENFLTGEGSYNQQDLSGQYIEKIFADVQLSRKLKVVIDAGNGAAGPVAEQLLTSLGCKVVPLNCDIDGQFPAHYPDPGKEENLQELIAKVKSSNAHIGLAFDGDGDRIGVVTNSGRIIWPDKLLMLLARDVLSRNKGSSVIYDVNCSRRLQGLIVGFGGKPLMWQTGRSNLARKLKSSGALLAGNRDGNIFFKERWFGFDDAIYTAARLLEILAGQNKSIDELFANFPDDVNTPELYIDVDEEMKVQIVEKLSKAAMFPGGTANTVDGLRVDFNDGWGLVRACQTQSKLSCRFEADNQASLIRIQEGFKQELRTIDSSLEFPF